jgi:hypothetical protein
MRQFLALAAGTAVALGTALVAAPAPARLQVITTHLRLLWSVGGSVASRNSVSGAIPDHGAVRGVR